MIRLISTTAATAFLSIGECLVEFRCRCFERSAKIRIDFVIRFDILMAIQDHNGKASRKRQMVSKHVLLQAVALSHKSLNSITSYGRTEA